MVKKFICLANLLLVVVLMAKGQEDVAHQKGGFGSPVMQYTTLANQWTFEAGGIGAGYITDHLYAGGGGFGSSSSDTDAKYALGYGGVLLGYDHTNKSKRLGWNVNLLAAYGGIDTETDGLQKESDDVWIVKPTVEFEIRIVSWIKLGLGGGYKVAMGSDIASFSNNDISSPFASASLRMGLF